MSFITSFIHYVGRQLILGGSIIAPILVGCVTRHYELEMTPVDGKLQRKITMWKQQSKDDPKMPIDDEELAVIAALYESEAAKGEGDEYSFTKIFSNRTPNDLGGAGAFTHWVTSLGSTTGYLERVRGDDDIAAKLEKRKRAADRLVDLLIGWSEAEFSGAPELPKVCEFLDTLLRRDLINMGIYAQTTELANFERSIQRRQNPSREQGEMEVVVRMIQYCIERNYVTPKQIPEWGYAIDQANQQRPDILIELVKQTLASKIGLAANQPMPAFLTRLSSIDDLNESLRSYLQNTEEYRELSLKTKPTTEVGDADPPDPCEVIGNLVETAVFPSGLFGGGDRLNATLRTHKEPMATNGRWNRETQRVEWTLSIEGRRADGEQGMLPDLLYALWVEPAVSVQIELFGKVVLDDASLLSYCLWYQGLPEEKASRWDEFLIALRPAPDLANRILAFRFDDEPAHTNNRAQMIRDLLVEGLR